MAYRAGRHGVAPAWRDVSVLASGTAPVFSTTLAIHEEVKRRFDAGEDILHLGFGEAGLPVHPLLREALAAGAASGGYGAVAGDPNLRRNVAGYYVRRCLETDAAQIVVGPGSKALLFALMLALDGDLVLPQPAWVSYAAQAALAGKAVLRVSVPAEAGGIPELDSLKEVVARGRANGMNPRLLLITHPDNPTGTVASRDALEEVLEVARGCGLFVIADEIYRDLVHEDDVFVSAAEVDDANCVVTGGLSKSLALGGWRVGTLRVAQTPDGEDLAKRVCAIASEIWSCIAAPIARAARVAYEEPRELVAHVQASRNLHAQVVAEIYAAVTASGCACRSPAAAFYLYPELTDAHEGLAGRGIDTNFALARVLLDDFGIAVMPGTAFGDEPAALRFRIATSLLYGESDHARWAALEAATAGRAAELPAVVDAASRLRTALESLLA
jgi:aspartate aminotransferase